ncbi:type III PLP-dependent enzyme domain-containing protein [Bacillus chungangensis]|uniref:D-serine deaminase-like pyridoxal phosphate-dependent protein n=1 Tax=Bacillus chungangensis TaxID=587633 RepID=A0ABT9WVP0_9BACI|nr:amino acid deaminase/aldolase [Bacillus chungangensis]MDQ0177168.1 D-serine deaminase-like pyridoxal phosphate-dependent protein [Bacillus chungangensis]
MLSQYKRYEAAFEHLPRPFAYLDLDYLDSNIHYIKKLLRSKRIRIATKSIRSVAVMTYIANKFPQFSGWMTFSAAETVYLLVQGLDQLLCAYPTVEKTAIEQTVPYIRKGREVIWMVDSLEAWQLLEEIGLTHNIVFSLCLDINVATAFPFLYFGTKRSPLNNEAALKNLLHMVASFTHTKVVGVMGYEAQIAGVGDVPTERWKRPIIPVLKKRSLKAIADWRLRAIDIIESYTGPLQFINGGGSGSLWWTGKQSEVTEVAVGSAFYFPALFDQYKSLALLPAAGFALSVTRKPAENIVVCHGGGLIASGAFSKDKFPQPYLPSGLSLLANEGAGEVQTPLLATTVIPSIGDSVYFRHAKAGELCERFSCLYGYRDGQVVETFTTYRGDGQCFL